MTTVQEYYNGVWRKKLSLPAYSTLEKRWRSRWDFAFDRTPPGSAVLDCGCGDGVLGANLIVEKRCSVIGVDASDYALGLAREKGLEVLEVDISAEKLPFPDEEFDVVVMSCVLEHVFDPLFALREATRVARTKASIFVTLPNVANIRNRLVFATGRLPEEFLHTRSGEGRHLQFYTYRNDFERRILADVPALRIKEKKGDLKNPRAHSVVGRRLLRRLISAAPNVFSEYVHWELRKTGCDLERRARKERPWNPS